jgi:hypothetical protein
MLAGDMLSGLGGSPVKKNVAVWGGVMSAISGDMGRCVSSSFRGVTVGGGRLLLAADL